MHEIIVEMSALLDQQSHLLNSTRSIIAMNASELEAYVDRNHRLRHLFKELNELP
jgi:hypothetical protein